MITPSHRFSDTPARKVSPDRVISVHDQQARHTRKSSSGLRDGYRAHVVAEPETGIVTGARLTMAAGEDNSDAAVAADLLAAEPGPVRAYGDAAYGTGGLRAALAAAGHEAVIKPHPLAPAVPGGFTLDDFAADEAAGTVTCPAGVTRRITARRTVTFGAACRDCPLRVRCTTRKDGRSLVLHQHHALLSAARADWAAEPDLRQDYRRHRPNIERTISQIATRGRRRIKLRYLGTTPNNAWLQTRTAALNLRNLVSRGLDYSAGTWTLA